MTSGLAAGLLGIVLQVLGLAEGQQAPPPDPLRIVVTVPPLHSLAKDLAPAGSEVVMLMKPGRSEHGYEFTPADIAQLGRADVVIYVGLGLEPQVEQFVLKKLPKGRQVVCLGVELGLQKAGEKFDAHAGHTHKEGEECDHAIDQHVWLDPVLVLEFLPRMRDSIERAGASRRDWTQAARDEHTARYESLKTKLEGVHQAWGDMLKAFQGRAIVTHHDAFRRPAERYGFKVARSIKTYEATEPTPIEIARVVEAIRDHRVSTIFIEPQFNPAAAERIAEVAKVRVGRLDPLGRGDWFEMMESNLKSLAEGLREPEKK